MRSPSATRHDLGTIKQADIDLTFASMLTISRGHTRHSALQRTSLHDLPQRSLARHMPYGNITLMASDTSNPQAYAIVRVCVSWHVCTICIWYYLRDFNSYRIRVKTFFIILIFFFKTCFNVLTCLFSAGLPKWPLAMRDSLSKQTTLNSYFPPPDKNLNTSTVYKDICDLYTVSTVKWHFNLCI